MSEQPPSGREGEAHEEHDAPGDPAHGYTEIVLAGGQAIMVGPPTGVSPPARPHPPDEDLEDDPAGENPERELELARALSLELAGSPQRDLTQFAGLVHALWRSSFVDHVRWEDALYIALAGADVGMGPTQALRNINVIDGKPTLSADAMAAICRRSPLCRYLRPVEMTPISSTWATWREGDSEEVRYTFSLDDARRAGLADGEFYKRYPAAMLKARALSHLCRAVYPDLIGGFYDPAELGDAKSLTPSPEDLVSRADARPEPFDPTSGRDGARSSLGDVLDSVYQARARSTPRATADASSSTSTADSPARSPIHTSYSPGSPPPPRSPLMRAPTSTPTQTSTPTAAGVPMDPLASAEPVSALVASLQGLDRRSRELLAGALRAMDEAARRSTIDRLMGLGALPSGQTLLSSRAREALEFLGVHGSRAHDQARRDLVRAVRRHAPGDAHAHAFMAFVCRSEDVERVELLRAARLVAYRRRLEGLSSKDRSELYERVLAEHWEATGARG